MQDLYRRLVRSGERIDNPDGSEHLAVRQVFRQKDGAFAGLGGRYDEGVPPRQRMALLLVPCALDDAKIDRNRSPCG